MSIEVPVITIDGPVASGKGSVAACVAHKLQWNLLESGVLYRALVVAAEQNNISLEDTVSLSNLAHHLDLDFIYQENNLPKVLLSNHDISVVVRSEMCGNLASKISQHSEVRNSLFETQRNFKKSPGLVAEGRDMGTVVFTDARYKFYIDATAETRAKRRKKQLEERGTNVNYDLLLEEIKVRDLRDINREVAPLKPAVDAIIIDTNHLNLHEVCEEIINNIPLSNL